MTFEIIPTWLFTPLICIAMGGLLMAAIVAKKKKMARQFEEAKLREAFEEQNKILAEKYMQEHPEEFKGKDEKKAAN